MGTRSETRITAVRATRALVLMACLVGTPALAQETLDVAKLPIDVSRVQRALRTSETREEHQGLKLNYVVNVYGQAPRIQLFTKADNLTLGRAPYGGPTHSEMLEVMTPKEFRAPTMNLGAALAWLAERSKGAR